MTAIVTNSHGCARTRGPQLRPYALRRLMRAAGLTAGELAAAAGVSERTIARLDQVGLTEAQAKILAGIVHIRPSSVWADFGRQP